MIHEYIYAKLNLVNTLSKPTGYICNKMVFDNLIILFNNTRTLSTPILYKVLIKFKLCAIYMYGYFLDGLVTGDQNSIIRPNAIAPKVFTPNE